LRAVTILEVETIEGDGLDTTAEDESVSRKERLAAGGRERGNGHQRR
jgi:hypothetical protein